MCKLKTLVPICLLVIFVSPLLAGPGEGVDLAQLKGWDIVLAKDAIPSEKYAAEEFQEFFRQASGIELPIVTAVDRPDRHVFIGPGKMLRSSNVAFGIDDFGDEDLRIIVRDDNIAIAGGRPRGTLYGVYTFLEEYLGVRFLTADHTHVPPVGDWRVVGPVDRFYHPPLRFRSAHAGELNFNADFSTRMRNNFIHPGYAKFEAKHGGSSRLRLINHTFYHMISSSKYGKEHPEYFSLVDGKRLAIVENDCRDNELCLTNPDVQRIVTQAVRKELDEHPEYRNVSVSQNDNDKYCRCPKCAAIDKREGTPTGSLLTFVNAVADEIAKTHPGVDVGTLAYLYSQKPPKTIKPRPNVQIMLASYSCSVIAPINDPRSKSNRKFREDLTAWGKISDNIMVWNYNINFRGYFWPAPTLRVIEPNIRFFVANNARGVFMQAAGNTVGGSFSDIRTYITTRLLWNPNLNGQQLMNEFLNLHYGKAAPPIRRFINLIHDTAEPLIDRGNAVYPERYGMDETTAKAALDAFEEALQLADDEIVRRRVEKASICAYALAATDAYKYAERLHWKLEDGPMAPELARRTRPYVKKLFELCEKYGATQWMETWSIDVVRDQFRRAYGLKENESF